MKLRSDFETARSNLMNRHPVPSLDTCLSELLREEQRIVTQTVMEHQANVNAPVYVAYAAQGRNKGRDMRVIQCFSCKAFGHIARDCPKKFCNYCKKQGHIIFVCPIRPERKQGTAYHASTSASSSTALPVASPIVPIPAPIALANPNTLTPEMVHQMIISAFSAFTLSGNHKFSSKPWYLDSGTSNHMTNTVVPLFNVRNYEGSLKINTADGNSLPISVVGDLSSSLTDVFVSPDLSTNLIFVGQLVDNDCDVHFSHSGCVVQDQVSGKMIAKGPKVGRLFPLYISPSTIIPSFPLLSFACNVVGSEKKIWHKRLGHPNSDVLHTLINFGLLGNKACSSLDLSFDCTSCKLGKSKVLPFPRHASRASQCFDIIHSDVWGIVLVISHAHYKYFVTFIDDFSRFTWVYFLRAKAEVFSVFKCFLALLETKFSARIKVLRSDSSGEYMSNEFYAFLQSKGIISQRSSPSTPQQNGVAERKNRHLLDVVRTLLLESSVPPRFWCETLSTSVHLINRLLSPMLNHVSPFFKLFGHSSLYSDLRTFGCVCFLHLPAHERHKLTTQSVKCAFLGYAIPQKGYVCYDPHVRRIRVSRNVIFF
jgi:transposase InsO family protein